MVRPTKTQRQAEAFLIQFVEVLDDPRQTAP
jgi:hypothetical protein